MSVTLDIVGLGHRGDGVAADGSFVPYTVPGDVVRPVRGSRVPEIVRPGPWRTTPVCRHFGRCGGCALQHVAMPDYLAWKHGLIGQALAQRGFTDVAIEPIRSVGPHTRRRAQLKAHRHASGIGLGFYESDSRTLVVIGECPVLNPALENLLPRLRDEIGRLLVPQDSAEIHLTDSDSGIDVALDWKRQRSPDRLQALAEFAGALGLARLSWNGETIAVRTPPMLRIGKHMVELPIEPFLQPTREGEAILQSLVRDGVAAARNVADLFSGCGTFSLALGGDPDIAAFDDNAGMIAALNGAVKAHGSRIRAERRDLFRRPLSAEDLSRYDAVVIDPPRPGAKAQSEQLARSKVPKIVYVSCSPASFSRDARILCDGGYRIIRIVPVDQFLWSSHLELVAFLERPPS